MEIECKVKVDSHDRIAGKLQSLGADFVGELEQIDTYFCDDADTIIASDKAIRIRLERFGGSEKGFLTYKGPKQNTRFKSRDEFEVEVSDIYSAIRILEGLGFRKRITVEKKRSLWHFDDCEVCLDDVLTLGTFVEIEGPDEQAVAASMKKIGISEHEHITKSYAHMIESQ